MEAAKLCRRDGGGGTQGATRLDFTRLCFGLGSGMALNGGAICLDRMGDTGLGGQRHEDVKFRNCQYTEVGWAARQVRRHGTR